MPKSKGEKLDDYYQNRNHVVGSEAWLTDAELETKKRKNEKTNRSAGRPKSSQ